MAAAASSDIGFGLYPQGGGLVGRQVEEVGSRIYVFDVEVGLLPHLHRLRQLDDGEGVRFAGRRMVTKPPHSFAVSLAEVPSFP